MELQPPSIIANQLSGLPAAVNDLLPWLIDINPFPTAVANTSFDTLTVDTACIFNGTKDSSGTVDNLIGWDIVLPAGTWSLELMHKQGADRGIYTVTFTATGASTTFGTIDGYAAATTRNVRSSLTGIIITAPAKGRLSLAMSSKNALSTKFTGSVQAVRLWRTA